MFITNIIAASESTNIIPVLANVCIALFFLIIFYFGIGKNPKQ